MSVLRALQRSLSPADRKKKCVTCEHCYAATYVTKSGKWYKHRQPPMQTSYKIPMVMGPYCPGSGKKVKPRA